MPHAYLGNQGTANGLTAGDAFFNRLGSTVAEKTYCESGSSTAWVMTVGPTGGLDVESMACSDYIIVWGMNMVSTNLHGWPFVLEAKAKGAKIVVIDPYKSRTAKRADWHLAIKPGTDAALALGMMNVIIEEDLYDHDYVAQYTLGFEELKARAAEFPVERVAMITGLAAADILQLSREYAKAKASAIRQGVAIERSPGGGDSVRAVTCLPALTGAWRQPGGGTVEMPIYEFPMSLAHVCRPDWIKPGTRVVNELDLGSALTGRMKLDPPIKSVFFYNSNPVSQAPDAGELVRGLKRDDLFTVASELFLTDTAKYADIILPACMEGEQYDIMVTWGHLYIQLNMPAIKPPGECMANIDMFRRLAKTMGYTDDYWDMGDDEWLTKAYDWDAPQLQGITLGLLKKDGWKRLNVGMPHERKPHAEGNFKTPSGKCEFASSLAAGGNMVLEVWRSGYAGMQVGGFVDPVPNYMPPHDEQVDEGEDTDRFPLAMLSPKPHAFLNTQYGNEKMQQHTQGEQRIMINPADAEARSIADGDYVKVFNDRGMFEALAMISEDVGAGLVVTNVGHWPGLNRTGTAVNSTTAPRHSNLGQAGVYSDNRVQIEPIGVLRTLTAAVSGMFAEPAE